MEGIVRLNGFSHMHTYLAYGNTVFNSRYYYERKCTRMRHWHEESTNSHSLQYQTSTLIAISHVLKESR